MQRHLGYKGLDTVFGLLKQNSFEVKISSFRRNNLLSDFDADKQKNDIIDLFNKISEKEFTPEKKEGSSTPRKKKPLGPTTAAKVLHLCCPDFFVMWDSDIRNQSGFSAGTGEKYFAFMLKMRNFWIELEPIIMKVQMKYSKRATRLIDEYNWSLRIAKRISAMRVTSPPFNNKFMLPSAL